VYRPDGTVPTPMTEIPQHPEPSAVRDRLLDAAERVVVRDGESNLTLDLGAREAGVSKGGLLYHFPSKSALVTAIVARQVTRCEADLQQALANESGPGAFTRGLLAAGTQQRDASDLSLMTALLAAAGTAPQYLDPFRERMAAWQASLENDGVDAAVATIVRLTMDGLALSELLRLPVPTGELRERIVARLLAMIADTTGKDTTTC